MSDAQPAGCSDTLARQHKGQPAWTALLWRLEFKRQRR